MIIFINGLNIESKKCNISPIYTKLKDEITRLGFLHALREWAAVCENFALFTLYI